MITLSLVEVIDFSLLFTMLLLVYWDIKAIIHIYRTKKRRNRYSTCNKPIQPLVINSSYSAEPIHQMRYLDHCMPPNIIIKRKSTTKNKNSVTPSTSNNMDLNSNSERTELAIQNLPTGWQVDNEAVVQLHQRFPDFSKIDIICFLTTKDGNMNSTTEMLLKCRKWRQETYPINIRFITPALETKCFFPFGVAQDGTPVIYMRGAKYDNRRATAEQYTLTAVYVIDHALRTHQDQCCITVVVHTTQVPEGPNLPADVNFIKMFIQVMTDYYPERLKKLILYPFPWYASAVWAIIRVFLDKASQEKVVLLSAAGSRPDVLPRGLTDLVDPLCIPVCCGGRCPDNIDYLIPSSTVESEMEIK